MQTARRMVFAAGALLTLAGLAACSSGSGSGDALMSTAGGSGTEGPIALTATPEQVVIDLNDPTTPIDPVSQEAYGESTITALVLDELAAPVPGVDVVFTTTGGTLASAGQPVVTDAEGKATDVLRLLESDPDAVEVTATSGADSATIPVTKVVIPLNAAPTADAGPDQEAECGDETLLDGSASTDPDSTEGTNDDIVTFAWSLGGEPLGEGETLAVVLPVGTHVVTLEVTDALGATDTAEVTVEVTDTLPPEVTVVLDPNTLWPPNHRMVDIEATVTVEDACPVPPATEPTIVLLSVTSDEPENGQGDGDTAPDIAGVDADSEDFAFQCRSERAGGGDGRVYTARYRVIDGAGNEVEAEGVVEVPHNQ